MVRPNGSVPPCSRRHAGARSAPLAAVSAVPDCLDVTHRSPPRLLKNHTGPGEGGGRQRATKRPAVIRRTCKAATK